MKQFIGLGFTLTASLPNDPEKLLLKNKAFINYNDLTVISKVYFKQIINEGSKELETLHIIRMIQLISQNWKLAINSLLWKMQNDMQLEIPSEFININNIDVFFKKIQA